MSIQTAITDFFVTPYQQYVNGKNPDTLNLWNVGIREGHTLEEWTDIWINEGIDQLVVSSEIADAIVKRFLQWEREGQQLETRIQDPRWTVAEKAQLRHELMTHLRRYNYLTYLLKHRLNISAQSLFVL